MLQVHAGHRRNVPHHHRIFAVGLGSGGRVVERAGLDVLAIGDDHLVVLNLVRPVGAHRDLRVGQQVHRSATGPVVVAMGIDHHLYIDAAPFGLHQRLDYARRGEAVGHQPYLLPGSLDHIEYQLLRAALG
ncbi:Unknown protein sequence [Pseudomonas amygdali pv. ulmi]|uniref:Uncharacterized protein n=1 Tax=Pseudomonas amygdali pv. ulmi TaxID=251720 RepID=A0A0Q0ELA7_PSEA0|nr:Unknown protein sequence [Pseudomonas amygdali pv. ulmi]